MTIKYKIGRAILSGVEKKFPRLVKGDTLSAEDFERKVAQRAARGLADVAAVFIAAREVLLEALREDQAVQVRGIGTFSVTLKGELDENERLVIQTAKLHIDLRAENDLREGLSIGQHYEYVGE